MESLVGASGRKLTPVGH